MSKEDIYDAEIAPLMNEILKICQAHKIAMVASFATPSDTSDDLYVSSALMDENGEFPGFMEWMAKIQSRSIGTIEEENVGARFNQP
jgi:hypothetical protein